MTLNLESNVVERISIQRLNTDFYESTVIELNKLWPKLIQGGILILDNYGSYTGVYEAVNEYFAELNFQPFLSPIRNGTMKKLFLQN